MNILCLACWVWFINIYSHTILQPHTRLLKTDQDYNGCCSMNSLQATLTLSDPLSPVGIKKKSKVPGVMITQFVEEIPEGKSHPDFTRKPIALTIQEGEQLRNSSLLTH